MVQWFDDLQFGHRQVKWLTVPNGGEMSSMAKLGELSSRPSGLTDYDRRLVQSILGSENSSAFLRLVEDLDCECAKMEKELLAPSFIMSSTLMKPRGIYSRSRLRRFEDWMMLTSIFREVGWVAERPNRPNGFGGGVWVLGGSGG
ncbi:hypothetical protein, partial [Actinomadura sp. NPDC048394]|uniref:hypothetical protein n=1 Tax=Actinomadura sp. NPDC048394 TaxID=3158223 RepID=UPI0033C87782